MRSEDPLFDPWGGAELGSTEQQAAAERVRESESPGQRWTLRLRSDARRSTPLPPIAVPPPAVDGPREPERRDEGRPAAPASPGDAGAELLRTLVLPIVLEAGSELRAARHDVVVDDRTFSAAPVIRFQLRPRPGPFDTPTRTVPVLEFGIVIGPDGQLGVEVRTWLDPLAQAPTLARTVPAVGELGSAGVREALLGFVAETLRLT